PFPMTFLERLQQMARGEVAQPPIAKLVGMALVSIEPDRAVFELEADAARHGNPMGTLHGGVLCDVADAAMGCAWASGLVEAATFTTIELKINFFRLVFRARLRAVARVVRRGRTDGLADRDVTADTAELVA